MPRTNEWLGWRGFIPDGRDRDFRYSSSPITQAEAPKIRPTRTWIKKIDKHPVFNQRRVGSCTGQAYGLHHAIERKVTPRSALFGYFEARRIIGEPHIDGGAYIRDVFKVGAKLGIPRDDLWPDVDENVFLDPHDKADLDAVKRTVNSYHGLRAEGEMLDCLASGHSFVIGFAVYGSFYEASAGVARHGIANLPRSRDPYYGGHAVLVGGYDLEFHASPWAQWAMQNGLARSAIPQQVFLCRNSWGIEWARAGNFAIDLRFFPDPWLAGDAQTARFLRR